MDRTRYYIQTQPTIKLLQIILFYNVVPPVFNSKKLNNRLLTELESVTDKNSIVIRLLLKKIFLNYNRGSTDLQPNLNRWMH